jgi:hypothetical protein
MNGSRAVTRMGVGPRSHEAAGGVDGIDPMLADSPNSDSDPALCPSV